MKGVFWSRLGALIARCGARALLDGEGTWGWENRCTWREVRDCVFKDLVPEVGCIGRASGCVSSLCCLGCREVGAVDG